MAKISTSENPRAKSQTSVILLFENLAVKFYKKSRLTKSLTVKMLHKKTRNKSKGEKITQQILTANNPTTKKWQKLRGRKPVIEKSDEENPT